MKEYGNYYEPTDEEKRKKLILARPAEQPDQEKQPITSPAHEEPAPEQNSTAFVLVYEPSTPQVKTSNRSEHQEPPTRSKQIEIFTAPPIKSEPPNYNSPTYWKETDMTYLAKHIEEGKITNPDVLPVYAEKQYNILKAYNTQLYTGKWADEHFKGSNREILAENLHFLDTHILPEIQGDIQSIRAMTKSHAETAFSNQDFVIGNIEKAEAAKNWIHIGKAYAAKHQPQEAA